MTDISRRKMLALVGGAAAAAAAIPAALIVSTPAAAPPLPDWCPEGFLPPDGRAISRATYASLFRVLGTTYGAGDGSTTFNLPDLAGRASEKPALCYAVCADQTKHARIPVGTILLFAA